MIARRHYFQTGTLRYFETLLFRSRAFQGNLFQNDLTRELGKADGRLVFCLPRILTGAWMMCETIGSKKGANCHCCPHDVFDLRELCHELVCLRWVSLHTPELEADRTAPRSSRARLVIAEQNLQSHLDWVFSPANKGRCDWYYKGKKVSLSSQRELNDLLSAGMRRGLSVHAIWRNELINRRISHRPQLPRVAT